MSEFTCSFCGGTFIDLSAPGEAEAAAAFAPEELLETITICDDCWRSWREISPELNARYEAR